MLPGIRTEVVLHHRTMEEGRMAARHKAMLDRLRQRKNDAKLSGEAPSSPNSAGAGADQGKTAQQRRGAP